jgi:predicted TIM-barrel fold metal-dependent hydrolase
MDPVADCPAPRADTRAPRVRLPRGACDAHFHVFGPYARYRLAEGRSYTPPPAPLAAYLGMAATLGLTRGVIVQPSVYGADNHCMLDALIAMGTARARGIAVLGGATRGTDVVGPVAMTDRPTLQDMDRAGVRGIRFNAVTGDRDFRSRLDDAARLVADLGWHIQLFVDPDALRDCLPRIRALPVDVVIDHLGQIDPEAGLDGHAFDTLRRALDTGRTWVKLTGYRCSRQPAPYADLAPYVRVLARDHGDRLVWGSNWPHPIRYHDMPEDGALVDALAGWLDDEAALHRVLVHNPARLYGFPPVDSPGDDHA